MLFDPVGEENALAATEVDGNFTPGLPASFSERVAVEYRAQLRDRNSDSLIRNRAALLDEQVQRAKELGFEITRPKVPGEGRLNTDEDIAAYNAAVDEIEAKTGVSLIKLNLATVAPGYPDEGSPDANVSRGDAWAPLDTELQKRALPERAEEADIRARTGGFSGVLATLVGAGAASLQDEMVAITVPFGAPAGAGFWGTVATEGAVNMALELPVQGILMKEAQERGIEVTLGTATVDILAAGVGAAGFSALTGGIAAGIGKALRKARPEAVAKGIEIQEIVGWYDKSGRAIEQRSTAGRVIAEELDLELPEFEAALRELVADIDDLRVPAAFERRMNELNMRIPEFERATRRLVAEGLPDTPAGNAARIALDNDMEIVELRSVLKEMGEAAGSGKGEWDFYWGVKEFEQQLNELESLKVPEDFINALNKAIPPEPAPPRVKASARLAREIDEAIASLPEDAMADLAADLDLARPLTGSERHAADTSRAFGHIQNPYGDTVEAGIRHADNARAVQSALERGEPIPQIDDTGAATAPVAPRVNPEYAGITMRPIDGANYVEVDGWIPRETRAPLMLMDFPEELDAGAVAALRENLADMGDEVIMADEATGLPMTAREVAENLDKRERLLDAMKVCKL